MPQMFNFYFEASLIQPVLFKIDRDFIHIAQVPWVFHRSCCNNFLNDLQCCCEDTFLRLLKIHYLNPTICYSIELSLQFFKQLFSQDFSGVQSQGEFVSLILLLDHSFQFKVYFLIFYCHFIILRSEYYPRFSTF